MKSIFSIGAACLVVILPAFAAETAIGQAVDINHMEVGAVYLQAVAMDCMNNNTQPYDIHLEADIHALQNNPNGFAFGEWIPYLNISYHLEKENSSWQQNGTLMPMVANDGPHYGENLKLNGAGKYRVTFHIAPPVSAAFCRHTDKETGVAPWWSPFDETWEFVYLGTGKKGGY